MKQTLFIISFLFLLLPRATSAQVDHAGLGKIQVNVDGTTRTKHHYIESLVKKCLEKGGYTDWASVDSAALKQCISNTKLFSSVEVAVKDAEINVKAIDRWTLLPIPAAYSSKGKRSAGLYLYESNFLGIGKTVVAGASASTGGSSFMLMYMDPSVVFSDHTLRVIASRSAAETGLYDKTTMQYGFNKTEKTISFAPGYKITPLLEVSVQLNYHDKYFSPLESYSYPVPDAYTAWSSGARLSYTNADYKLFYNDGLSWQVNMLSQIKRSDDKTAVTNATAKLNWDMLLFGSHALQLGMNTALQSEATIGDVSTFGRKPGFRGIQPEGLWTKRIVAASADYQIPFKRVKQGTFTVAPFFDYGIYKPLSDKAESSYAAYGVGTYFFLNAINLPGIGLVAGVNEEFMGSFVAFQIGMGF